MHTLLLITAQLFHISWKKVKGQRKMFAFFSLSLDLTRITYTSNLEDVRIDLTY